MANSPSISPAPAPPHQIRFPLEVTHAILTHLNPKYERQTLLSASLVSHSWYLASFSLLHRTLTISKSWTPHSINGLIDDLKANPRIANSIRSFHLKVDQFNESEWGNYYLEWVCEFYDGACEECLGSSCQLAPDGVTMLHEFAEGKLERDRMDALEEADDLEWIRDWKKSEKKWFEVLRLLPGVNEVEVKMFRHRVEARMREEDVLGDGEGGKFGAGEEGAGAQDEGKAAEDDAPPALRDPSYIDKVTLVRCSPLFKKSLSRHWRFSRITQFRTSPC